MHYSVQHQVAGMTPVASVERRLKRGADTKFTYHVLCRYRMVCNSWLGRRVRRGAVRRIHQPTTADLRSLAWTPAGSRAVDRQFFLVRRASKPRNRRGDSRSASLSLPACLAAGSSWSPGISASVLRNDQAVCQAARHRPPVERASMPSLCGTGW